MSNNYNYYTIPLWVCSECGNANKDRWSEEYGAVQVNEVIMFHTNTCNWCCEIKKVTYPEYYGYRKN